MTARDVLDSARSAREHGREYLADALLDLAEAMSACRVCGCVRVIDHGRPRCALCGADLLRQRRAA